MKRAPALMRSVQYHATRGVLVLCSAILFASPGLANAPYGAFQSMTNGQLSTLQIKLTNVVAFEVSPTILVASTSDGRPDTIRLKLFWSHERPEVAYFNDHYIMQRAYESNPKDLYLTTLELRRIIDSVAVLSVVTAGSVDTLGMLAFSMLNTIGSDTLMFEAVLDSTHAKSLFEQLRKALAENPQALGVIARRSCGLGTYSVLDLTPLNDAVAYSFGGFRYDRRSGRYRNLLTVRNMSASAIDGPILVTVPIDAEDVSLANAHGTTCGLEPLGTAYVYVLSTGSLAPGASVTMLLEFENPNHVPIHLSWEFESQFIAPAVYAGLGVP